MIDRRAGAPTVVSHGEQGLCGQWQSVLALQTEAQFLLTSLIWIFLSSQVILFIHEGQILL